MIKLITHTPNIEDVIVEIARVSSGRKDKTAQSEKLINYLIRNAHWSPFEHGYVTFEIETSKAIAIQLLVTGASHFRSFRNAIRMCQNLTTCSSRLS
jgi:thymidylate synthase ThyX